MFCCNKSSFENIARSIARWPISCRNLFTSFSAITQPGVSLQTQIAESENTNVHRQLTTYGTSVPGRPITITWAPGSAKEFNVESNSDGNFSPNNYLSANLESCCTNNAEAPSLRSEENNILKEATYIWPQYEFAYYRKGNFLGEGGTKKCWKITYKDASSSALLEYRYPTSPEDEIFAENETLNDKIEDFEQTFDTKKSSAENEIAILISLKNKPNVIQIYNVLRILRTDGREERHCIVKYYNQGSFCNFLKSGSSLSAFNKYSIACDLLQGLVSTSEAGVLISDIKPENILLEDIDGRLHASICDFESSQKNYRLGFSYDLISMLKLIQQLLYDNKNLEEFKFIDNAINGMEKAWGNEEFQDTQNIKDILLQWQKKFSPIF